MMALALALQSRDVAPTLAAPPSYRAKVEAAGIALAKRAALPRSIRRSNAS